MASIGNDANGRKRILFFAPDGVRKTLRLGQCDKKTAESINRMVEFLVSARASCQPIPLEVVAWLNDLGPGLKTKLAKCKLIDDDQGLRKTPTLSAFLGSTVLNRQDIKPATHTVWKNTCRNLIEFFGGGRELGTITAGDASSFKEWLVASPCKRRREVIRLALTTVAKRIKFSRQFFERAVDLELIGKNPFRKVKCPGDTYSREKEFITRQTMELLMRVADPAWQGILALARYGGLRNPSETLSLKWSQVHWDKRTILVPSCKTEHHPGKGFRLIPLFPELVAPLRLLEEIAPEGAEYVIPGHFRETAIGPRGWTNTNLRKSFYSLCVKAGLDPIMEPFRAMRATRATELCEAWPIKTVVSWMGHDVKILLRHYAQVPQEHFDRACNPVLKSGTESGTVVAHFPAQQQAVGNGQDDKIMQTKPYAVTEFAAQHSS
ncbi:MAG: hypothetical protein EXR99_12390 [Gemmataceae bacterium]|nr:hypothetical protein [Gemmataceae bacterium]